MEKAIRRTTLLSKREKELMPLPSDQHCKVVKAVACLECGEVRATMLLMKSHLWMAHRINLE